jgi:hypothetical protein
VDEMIKNSNALKYAIIPVVALSMVNMATTILQLNYAFEWSYILVAGSTVYFATMLYEEIGVKYFESSHKI